MLTINKKLHHPDSLITVEDTVALSFDYRQKSRFRAMLASGREAGFFMERGSVLRGGDLVQADDGTVIQVQAADQLVMMVTSDSTHDLVRAAYHLGNRHVPLEVGPNWLKFESDYVLKDMLLGLGVQVEEKQAPFEPEAGAYGGGHHHHHHDHHEEHEH